MKRKILAVFIVIAALFTLCACREIPREELIPKKLGEKEGLWLYKGNERMRTDGSERETMFDSIELDGETVTDFTVDEYQYCIETNKIFFNLKLEAGNCIYLYDYIEGSGQVLWEMDFWAVLRDSGDYMYVESGESARLYRHDGTLVSTEIERGLIPRDGLLCREEGDRFFWWRDGSHSVELTAENRKKYGGYIWESFVRGDFFYYVGRLGCIFEIDLVREEVTEIPYEGEWSKRVWLDGADYLLSYTQYDSDGTHDYRLYELKNGVLRLAGSFPSDAHITLLEYGDGYLNFRSDRVPVVTANKSNYFHYSIADGELRSGSAKIEKEESRREYLVCGEYSFWVTYKTRFGLMSSTYCYYLNRGHGDEVEIMQYSFEDDEDYNEGHFFDDIRAE